MNFQTIKSFAKINLSLGVTGKLKSGYHKIESLVSFLNLYDVIKIKKIEGKKHKIIFIGKFSKGIKKINTISKLISILDKKKILNKKKYLIIVKKNIPQKAGLGGGSMNASSIIRFFIYKKILNEKAYETILNYWKNEYPQLNQKYQSYLQRYRLTN